MENETLKEKKIPLKDRKKYFLQKQVAQINFKLKFVITSCFKNFEIKCGYLENY